MPTARKTRQAIGIAVAGAAALLALYWFRPPSGRLLAWGRFHDAAHRGEGIAAIYEVEGRRRLTLSGLRAAYRPGLEVLLISAPDAFDNERVEASDRFVAGPLPGPGSDFSFDLPPTLDLVRYRAVTIWLPEYRVNFTTAPLRPPELPPFRPNPKEALP